MEKDSKNIKKRRGLALKLVIAIVFIVAVVSVASVWVGRSIYWDDITKHYDTVTKEVATAVQGMFTQQEIDEWGELATRACHGEDVQARIDVAHIFLRAGEREIVVRALLFKAVGEIRHAHDAAETGAGDTVDLLAGLVLEDLREATEHPFRQHPVFAGAARGEGTLHSPVGFHDSLHVGAQRLAGPGQQAERIQHEESSLRVAREGGVLLIAGAVTAIV